MTVVFSTAAQEAIQAAANAIAPDILDQCDDNEDFVSYLLDSDYLTIYGSEAGQDDVRILINLHGFEAVLNAASALWVYK